MSYPQLVTIEIEEALQESLPARIPVQLIEEDPRRGGCEPIQPQGLNEGGRSRQEPLPVILVVPVDVEVGVCAARGRLPYLARPAHEGHLAVEREVLSE